MSDLDNFEKVGEQLGSNPGGTYKNKVTGELYYLKFPVQKNSKYGNDIAKNEVLAAKLYQLAGVKVPELSLLEDEHGNFIVSSKIETSFKPAYDPNNKQKLRNDVNWHELTGVQEGLAVDAWLANWDVVGLEYDNIGTYLNPQTNQLEAFRLDTGGALIFRAQGELKGDKFDTEISEINSLRGKDSNVGNKHSLELFANTSDSKIEEGVEKLTKIKDETIIELVGLYGPGTEEEKKDLAYKLIVRKNKLERGFTNLELALSRNELDKLYNIIQDKENSEYFEYAYSPLNKNEETKLFEQLVHQLADDPDNKKQLFTKDDKEQVFLKWNGQSINFKELVNKVNFNHLSISQEDIKKYADYVTKNLIETPKEKDFRDKIHNTKDSNLDSLDYGEMIAIYKYTTEDFYDINGLLRDSNQSPDKIPLLSLHAAIASHGLNKLPEIELPTVIRYKIGDKLDQHLEDVKNKRITQEKAFISTSIVSSGRKSGFNKGGSGITIIYQNIRGKDISTLSHSDTEKEYLIPPSSQIIWTGYQRTKNGHVFTARGANVLLDSQTLKTGIGKSLSYLERQNRKAAALASYEAMKLYKEKSIIDDNLKTLNTEQLEALSSDNAMDFYKELYGSIDNLKHLTKDQIINLVSPNAQKLYKEANIETKDLEDLNKGQIDNLSIDSAIQLYSEGFANINELKDLRETQLGSLTYKLLSYNAKKLRNIGFKPKDLENLTKEQIDDLGSSNKIIAMCKNDPQIITFLINLPGDKIKPIVSWQAEELYDKGFMPIDLENLTEEQMGAIGSSDDLIKLCKNEPQIVTFLKNLSEEKIKSLTSYNAEKLYNIGFKPMDLENLTKDQMRAIGSSDDLIKLCKNDPQIVTFLKNLSAEQIEPLTSYNALKLYKIGFKPKDLENLTKDQIETINSNQIAELCEKDPENFSFFKNLSIEQIMTLISYNALKIYKIGFKPKDLENLTKDQIETITLNDKIIELCEKDPETFTFLKNLPADKIKPLVSWDAEELYDKGFKPKDLVNLAIEKIKMIASSTEITELCKNDPQIITFLKNVPADKIKPLVSWQAEELYDKGFKPMDLENLTKDQIDDLASNDKMAKLYKQMYNTNKSLAKYTVENYKTINNILEDKILSLEELTKCNLDQVKSLVDKKITPEKLKQDLVLQTTASNTKIIGDKTKQIIEQRAQEPRKKAGPNL